MTTNLLPQPEQTLSGRSWEKYPEKANQLLSNTLQKNKTETTSKFFPQQLQSTFPYFKKKRRETKTQFQVQ